MDLCESFQLLSYHIWDVIADSRVIKYQIQEETFTDIIIFYLKKFHSELQTIGFNKREEGVNGADWEWWFTDGLGKWIGFRVQAKVLDIDSERFGHLYYRKDKASLAQYDKLISEAAADPLYPCIPLYAMYLQHATYPEAAVLRPHTSNKHYGCSVVSAYKVRSAKAARKSNRLRDWQGDIIPWHELVCHKRGAGSGLVDHINRLATNNFLNGQAVERSFIISEPPSYISQAAQSDRLFVSAEENPHNLAGAVVFRNSIEENNSHS